MSHTRGFIGATPVAALQDGLRARDKWQLWGAQAAPDQRWFAPYSVIRRPGIPLTSCAFH
jgi:hypothetical protein